MRAVVASSILMLAGAVAPASARTEAPIFRMFEGDWVSHGVAFERSARTRMNWEPAPGGWRLDYRVAFVDAAGGGFHGVAFYRAAGEGKYAGAWADSDGDMHPIEARDDGVTLMAHWVRAGEPYGRTEYELTEDGSLQVTEWTQRGGQWRQVNDQRFSRQGT